MFFYLFKGKGKVVTVLNQVSHREHVFLAPRHEDVWVSGGMTPSILNLGTRWR